MCALILMAAWGCGAYSDVVDNNGGTDPDTAKLSITPAYVILGKTASMELKFNNATDLGLDCISWHTVLDFGSKIGYSDAKKISGCLGIRANIIVGADAEVGPRQVHLTFVRVADGEWDGYAELWVVPPGGSQQ